MKNIFREYWTCNYFSASQLHEISEITLSLKVFMIDRGNNRRLGMNNIDKKYW